MRVVQIIDSLNAGGAERIAVNYANALADKITLSTLVATRQEGVLKKQINEKVTYLFLDKKNSFDLKSVFKLKSFIKTNKITIIHAHGTSFFIATLLKLVHFKVKIIWHEHYGARVSQSIWSNFALGFSSVFFSYVLVVNHQLETWVKKNLYFKKVSYMPNFAIFEENCPGVTFLSGNDQKRIVCLANLKNPKNHITILSVFKNMKLKDLGWSLHLIGKDYLDNYSMVLKNFIQEHNLEKSIFFYDSKNDIKHILSQSTIGILASTAEGFPVVLLEYGLAKLPVVCTNVGYCPLIIRDNVSGFLFNPLNHLEFQTQLQKMISEELLRTSFGLHLHELVLNNYSKEKIITFLLTKYNAL